MTARGYGSTLSLKAHGDYCKTIRETIQEEKTEQAEAYE